MTFSFMVGCFSISIELPFQRNPCRPPIMESESCFLIPAVNESQLIPSRADINVYDSLDERIACEDFLGKSFDEAEALFRENSLNYLQDLVWMGPVAFRFYIRAAIAYVLSEHATDDSDSIHCLANTLASWHEDEPAELIPCARLLADFCGAVLEQFDRYDADPEIYIGLREKYQQLAELFTRIANEPGNA